MNALDHDTFHALEIDVLYDELEGARAAEIHAHAASCESCASRFERLRRARTCGLAALAESVSSDFESRVMAAVDAALARRASGPLLVPRPSDLQNVGPSPASTSAGPGGAGVVAKVIPFFSRPSFAVAATLILVLGAAAILGQLSMAKQAAPTAAPVAELSASSLATAPMGEEQAATAAPVAPAVVTLAANDPGPSDDSANANGLAQRGRTGAPAAAPKIAARRPARVAANEPAPPPPSPAKSKPIGGAASGGDGSLGTAKALYDAGNYREALPQFDALRGRSPEADLYAARCVLRLSGCSAAVPRFDGVASRNAGSDIGSRARAERDACGLRLQAGKNAAPAATATGAGTPGGAAGRPSAPKAPIEQFDSK